MLTDSYVCSQVLNLIKPVASVKRLFVTLSLSSDLPEYAVGDEKRLMQIILNIIGNAVKFSKEGSISISAIMAKPDSLRDPRAPDFFPLIGDSNFFLRVQVYFPLTLQQFYFFASLRGFKMGRLVTGQNWYCFVLVKLVRLC